MTIYHSCAGKRHTRWRGSEKKEETMPSYGDMVLVTRDERVIGQGIICGGDIYDKRIKWIQTGYGDGWHEERLPYFLTQATDTITMVEECWQQKWARRNR
jgi:hypothetical protein